jgi:pimeloyl-ACP methyl ester carboxylesterase
MSNPPASSAEPARQASGVAAREGTLAPAPEGDHAAEALAPALSGEFFRVGGIGCYVAGRGPPLLLVHSVNAAASAAEMRPLYEQYRHTRTVFAPDLPGFGRSERSARRYTPKIMTDAIEIILSAIQERMGPQPVDALALSLGCEFLARAAAKRPECWGRLALVSPTGFRGRARRGAPGTTRLIPAMYAIVSYPLWSERLFRGLVRPGVVRYFLGRTWGSKAIDEALWAYCVESAHQPGARYAPLDFLSGGLFSADILDIYEALSQPVWMSHGVRGDFTDYRGQRVVAARPNWSFSTFQTGALPYFEEPLAFFRAFDAFLAGAPVEPASP